MTRLSDNALITLNKRYFLKDREGNVIETWDGLCRRVAKAIALDEKEKDRSTWEQKYFDLINDLYFVPNTPTLMNAGKKNGQLAACFVLSIEDNMISIMDTAKNAALIHKSGGGTGFNFSKLRPANSLVATTTGTASGPVSFMEMYDGITEKIKQGGTRRGANMGILRIDHPDILQFIDCKQNLGDIENFNISVAITDEFMIAVKENKTYDLINPKTKQVVKKLNAKTVFNKIVDNAWKTGEPGLFFIDTANKSNSYGEIEATNPCVTGDTKIATLEGNIPIKELAGKWAKDRKDILVYTWNKKTKLPEISVMTRPCQTRHNAKIIKIVFDSGLELKCTPDHHLFTFRGKKIQAKDLKVGKRVRAFSVSNHPDGHERMHGWVNNKTSHIYSHRALWEFYNGSIPDRYEINHKNGKCNDNRIENLEILTNYEHNSLHYKERFNKGFHSIGVNKSEECGKKISESLKKYHKEKIKNHKIVSIESCENEDVYNGTVEKTHAYIIADDKYCGDYEGGILTGIVSANCGEQPLRNNEACNLGSINLVKFVNNAGIFAWNDFTDCVSSATRFLDSVISVNNYPLEIIKETHAETRKIGLGVMGYADALIKMSIEYGAKESFDFADRVYKLLSRQSKLTSELLGKEKGICKASDKYRNYWTTTIAPTGTISIIAGCSSGIEPNFSVAFLRKILDGETLIEINPVFKLLMEQEGLEINKNMENALLVSASLKDVKGIPQKIKKIFKTSFDVTPEQHVTMQAIFQKYSDSGISKTINLSEDAKKIDIAKSYMQAWETGCKGITVYRDGSRPNQPMSNKKDDHARKTFNRITKMRGFTEKIRTTLGNLYLTINNHAHGDPGEIILNIGKSGADIQGFAECIARLVSVSLQYGIPPHKIAEQMIGLKGEDNIIHEETKYLSIPDLVGRKLNEAAKEKTKDRDIAMQKCPQCQNRLYMAEGCKTCLCGYSRC